MIWTDASVPISKFVRFRGLYELRNRWTLAFLISLLAWRFRSSLRDPAARYGELLNRHASGTSGCRQWHAAAVALAAVLIAPAANAREFRAADIQDENYPTVQALRIMDQLVTRRTEKRHSIRVFHSRQLGEESQTVEQTRVGAIDINRINVSAIGDAAPILDVLALPFLFRSADHLYKVIDGPIGTEILGALEPYGFVGLAFYDSGARSIYTARRPVRTVDDLRGQRIRVQQSVQMSKMIRSLGGVPLTLPYGQIGTALTANLIDGAENNWPSFVTSGHFKEAPFYAMTEHTMGPEIVIMSRRAWDELTDEDRTIFRAAARESSRYMREQWLSWEQRSRAQAVSAGVTVVDKIDRKAFEAATAPLRNAMLKDSKFAPLIKRIEAER
ncbi:MAG: DctP family TRAP transporter solute-binding subunit [Rhizobiales bacterium]|nr:DctP family TRAP transporter solute-binding subunit [Hyphomicrobiales bacterium]